MKVAAFVTMLFITATLAGCADSSESTPEEDSVVLEEVQASATTGGVRGVVVDQTIRPIPDAIVTIPALQLETRTSEAGAFSFGALPDGEVVIEATHPLYNTVQHIATVEVGVTAPAPVKIILERVIASDPYLISWNERGYISCSANLLVPGLGGLLSEECGEGIGSPEQFCDLDSTLPCEDNPVFPGERIGKQDNNRAQIDFWLEGPTVRTLVVEQVWEPSVNIGTGGGGFNTRLATDWACDPFCGGDQHAQADGTSPLLMRVDAEQLANIGVTPDLRWSTFTWASTEETGLLLQQDYEVFVSAAHVLPLPEDWSFVAGDPDPFE